MRAECASLNAAGAANQKCVAMPYLVEMLAWEVKVAGSRLRHMGERPGALVFLNRAACDPPMQNVRRRAPQTRKLP